MMQARRAERRIAWIQREILRCRLRMTSRARAPCHPVILSAAKIGSPIRGKPTERPRVVARKGRNLGRRERADKRPADSDIEHGWGSPEFLVMATVGVATALMLQSTRVFLSYLVFVVDQSNRAELAAAAFGTFLLFLLGAVVVRLGAGTAWGLALARARSGAGSLLQFWDAAGGAAGARRGGDRLLGLVAAGRAAGARAGAARRRGVSGCCSICSCASSSAPSICRGCRGRPAHRHHRRSLSSSSRWRCWPSAGADRRACGGALGPGDLAARRSGRGWRSSISSPATSARRRRGADSRPCSRLWLWALVWRSGSRCSSARSRRGPGRRPRRGRRDHPRPADGRRSRRALAWDGVGNNLAFLAAGGDFDPAACGLSAAQGRRDRSSGPRPWLAEVWLTVGMVAHAVLLFAYFTWTARAVPCCVVAIAGLTLGAALADPARGDATGAGALAGGARDRGRGRWPWSSLGVIAPPADLVRGRSGARPLPAAS